MTNLHKILRKIDSIVLPPEEKGEKMQEHDSIHSVWHPNQSESSRKNIKKDAMGPDWHILKKYIGWLR